MTTSDFIKHQGKIERIDKQRIFVRIEQQAACQDCHAGAVCMASDKKDKVIEINEFSGSFTLQEKVIVSVRQSTGLFAAFLAYIMPLVFVIIAIIAGIYASGSEVIGGLIGLSVLFPYYFILYLLRDKMKKKIIFSLSKIPDYSIINNRN